MEAPATWIEVRTMNRTYQVDIIGCRIKGHPTYCPDWTQCDRIYTEAGFLWFSGPEVYHYAVRTSRLAEGAPEFNCTRRAA